jgi:hypothetical protein
MHPEAVLWKLTDPELESTQGRAHAIDRHIIIRRQAHSHWEVDEKSWGNFVEFSVLTSLEENKIVSERRQAVFNHHPEYIIRFITPKTAENKHGILFSSIALGLPGNIYVGPFSMWSIVVKLPSKMNKGRLG